jgi:hypothetical protein
VKLSTPSGKPQNIKNMMAQPDSPHDFLRAETIQRDNLKIKNLIKGSRTNFNSRKNSFEEIN